MHLPIFVLFLCRYTGEREDEDWFKREELADTVLAVLALMISLLLIAFSEMSMVIISTIAY